MTCKHVAQQLSVADQARVKFEAFRAERAQFLAGKKSQDQARALQKKYGYSNGALVEMYNMFVNCIEGPLQLEVRLHPSADVALLKFSNFTRLTPDAFATFAKTGTDLKQGMVMCRLGFPFPEFTNFAYDATTDHIHWTSVGRSGSPQFPMEGMVTRHLSGPGGIVGFELSTPGLKGQSGGPAFDSSGHVWGMQAATSHLDLDFDIDMDVLRNGQKRHVKESAFLHVGHCIHLDVLKQFMRLNGVAFQEAG